MTVVVTGVQPLSRIQVLARIQVIVRTLPRMVIARAHFVRPILIAMIVSAQLGTVSGVAVHVLNQPLTVRDHMLNIMLIAAILTPPSPVQLKLQLSSPLLFRLALLLVSPSFALYHVADEAVP